jgi:CBS domain-containing protein
MPAFGGPAVSRRNPIHLKDRPMKDICGITASDVMHGPVVCASPDETLNQLEDRLAEKRISGMPVVEDGVMVGIISQDDVIRSAALFDTMSNYVYSELLASGPMLTESADNDRDGVPDNLSLQGMMATTRVRSAMAKSVISCHRSTPIEDVICMMTEHHVHRVVVAESEKPVGIISTLDILHLLMQP